MLKNLTLKKVPLKTALVVSSLALCLTPPAAIAASASFSTDVEPAYVGCTPPDGKWPAAKVTLGNKQTDVYIPGSRRVYGNGDPRTGSTLVLSSGEETTSTQQLSSSLTVEAGMIFGKVSAQAGTSISQSLTRVLTSGMSFYIEPGRRGYIEAGMHGIGYKVTLERFSSRSCKFEKTTGTAKYPTSDGSIWFTTKTWRP